LKKLFLKTIKSLVAVLSYNSLYLSYVVVKEILEL